MYIKHIWFFLYAAEDKFSKCFLFYFLYLAFFSSLHSMNHSAEKNPEYACAQRLLVRVNQVGGRALCEVHVKQHNIPEAKILSLQNKKTLLTNTFYSLISSNGCITIFQHASFSFCVKQQIHSKYLLQHLLRDIKFRQFVNLVLLQTGFSKLYSIYLKIGQRKLFQKVPFYLVQNVIFYFRFHTFQLLLIVLLNLWLMLSLC